VCECVCVHAAVRNQQSAAARLDWPDPAHEKISVSIVILIRYCFLMRPNCEGGAPSTHISSDEDQQAAQYRPAAARRAAGGIDGTAPARDARTHPRLK
jgi:hypothetical protein